MSEELVKLVLGTLLGIFVSIPVSLGLLLALTRKPDTRVEYVRTVQGEVMDEYKQLGAGE